MNATSLRTTIPADFRALEAAINTGVPDRLDDGRVRRAIRSLAEELHLVAPRQRGLALRRTRGSVALDFAAMILPIGIVLLVLWQLVVSGFTAILASHAARAGARELAVTELTGEQLQAHVDEVVDSSLPAGWRTMPKEVEVMQDRVRVLLTVPALVPGASTPLRIPAEAGTVLERDPAPAEQPLRVQEPSHAA